MDMLCVPVNGRSYFRLQSNIYGNMTAEEAVVLALRSHAKTIVPIHHGLYPSNGLNPAIFIDILKSFSKTLPFHIFIPGERYILMKQA